MIGQPTLMSHRRQQLESSLQRAIGAVLAEGLGDPRIKGLVSVTSVSVSPELKQATVYVSVMPAPQQDLTLHGLRHAAGHIQTLVSRQVRARHVPHLDFQIDESIKRQAEVLAAIHEAVADTAPADAANETETQTEPDAAEPSP